MVFGVLLKESYGKLYKKVLGSCFPKIMDKYIACHNTQSREPWSFSDLRPICLCNFCVKVVSKIMTTRLAPILASIITEEQGGFTKDRRIVDNILLA